MAAYLVTLVCSLCSIRLIWFSNNRFIANCRAFETKIDQPRCWRREVPEGTMAERLKENPKAERRVSTPVLYLSSGKST